MNLDGTALGSLFTAAGAVVTAIYGIIVATRKNANEKMLAAEKALVEKQEKLDQQQEEIWEGRMRLKDEEIESLQKRLTACLERGDNGITG